MKLTAQEFTALHDALVDAFIDYNDLELMVARTGRRLSDITTSGSMPEVTLKLMRFAETRDWIDELIVAARAANPSNEMLVKVAAAIGLEPGAVEVSETRREEAFTDVSSALENLVDQERGLVDVGIWAANIPLLSQRICQVEVSNQAKATGFLIGPETVLTAYSALESAINGETGPDEIGLRFDYTRLRDGTTVNAGVEERLAQDWLVDFEPYSAADIRPRDESKIPGENELDYAVLRTSQKVGFRQSSGTVPMERGWITPQAEVYEFILGAFLMMAGHPEGGPLKLSGGESAIQAVNANRTRVRYRIDSAPGSSGSPVLDRHFEVVCMHHAKVFLDEETEWESEGIPMTNIQANVASKGLSWVFGKEAP